MTRKVFCEKHHQELPGLERSPYPGPTGQRILEHISEQAWKEWIAHQTMLINEYRLNLMDAQSRQFLEKEMEKFLFGSGSEKPQGYMPPSQGD